MDIIVPLSTFDEFRADVVKHLNKKADKHRNKRPRSHFYDEYKEKVGKYAQIFMTSVLKDRPEILNAELKKWFGAITEKSVAYRQITSVVYNTTINTLATGGGKLDYAVALHYRLHAQLTEDEHQHSDCDIGELIPDIDNHVFGYSYQLPSGEPLFKWVPDGLRNFSYPRIVDLKESYQATRSEFEEAKTLFLKGDNKSVALSTAVYGAGGYGKSSLAQELCLDKEIQGAFPGGVYWLQFGMEIGDESDEKVRYQGLREAIDQMLLEQFSRDDRPDVVLEGTDRDIVSLVEKLPDRRILLIADDIWTINECSWFSKASPFSNVSDHVSLLVTTRIESVAKEAAREIKIERLTDEASFQLLTHSMEEPTPEQTARLWDIAEKFKGWPLILNLANGVFKRRKGRTPAAIDHAITRYESFLDNNDITGWDLDQPGSSGRQQRQKFVGYCIDASLKALEKNRPELLLDLAVFPDDTEVPMSVLIDYWCHDADPLLTQDTALELLDLYQDHSFFSSFEEDRGTVRLHDEVLAYFRRSRVKGTVELHKKLLGSMQLHCNDVGWESLDREHRYGWEHVLEHLESAGDAASANELRTEFTWIKEKLKVAGLSGLLDSYNSKNVDDEAELVGRALGVSTTILSGQEQKLALQLFGRLGRNPSNRIASLIAAAQSDPDFWPRPSAPHLDTLGNEILRITPGTTGQARFADSEGARILLVANGKVSILDANNGKPIVDFANGEEPIRRVMICPNRQFLLAIGFERTAWIWDMLNGRRDGELLEHDYPIYFATFRADGRRILTVSGGFTATLWNFQDGEPIGQTMRHKGPVITAVFNPVNDEVLTASADGTAQIWSDDVSDGNGIAMLHDGPVNSAVYRQNGQFVVTASDDMTAQIWDGKTGRPSGDPFLHDAKVVDATVLEFGRRVLTMTSNGYVWFWNADPVHVIKKR